MKSIKQKVKNIHKRRKKISRKICTDVTSQKIIILTLSLNGFVKNKYNKNN